MGTIEVSYTTHEIIGLKKQLKEACDNITEFLHEMYPSDAECEKALEKFGEIDLMLNDAMIGNISEELAGSDFKRI